MCGFPPPLKDVLYLTVNTLQLNEHTHMPGWQRDCGVKGNVTVGLFVSFDVFLDEETGQETAAAAGTAADSGAA